jgi:hypothetical protein
LERNERSIDILAFPVVDPRNIPAEDTLPSRRQAYSSADKSQTRVLPWGLTELKARRLGGVMAFFHPVRRQTMPHAIPTYDCDNASDSAEKGFCSGRMLVDPDAYVVYTFPQRLLPCWSQLEEGVRRVVELNLSVK